MSAYNMSYWCMTYKYFLIVLLANSLCINSILFMNIGFFLYYEIESDYDNRFLVYFINFQN